MPSAPPLPTPTNVSAATIALGAYISGAPWDATKIDQFASMVGATPAIVMWYQDWLHPGVREFDPVKMNAVSDRGAVPMVTWDPWDDARGATQPAFALGTILGGTYDAFLRDWARNAATWNRPFYLRFAPEMNGDWFSWGVKANGNTSAQYVATWRHVVDIFRQEQAANVRWVWCPNADLNWVPFGDLYPGDAYVDWVALDGYNWGASQPNDPNKHWTAFADVFGPSYAAILGLTNKPLMIAETASTELGGDKAQWIAQSLLTELPVRFPRVRAVIWFDENKETDWRVNSSSPSLAAYRTVAASPVYRGDPPLPLPTRR